MRAHRVDETQAGIVRALRRTGTLVFDTSALPGFVDLVVWRPATQRLVLLECKTPAGHATPAQDRLVAAGWPVYYVRDEESALRVMGRVYLRRRRQRALALERLWRMEAVTQTNVGAKAMLLTCAMQLADLFGHGRRDDAGWARLVTHMIRVCDRCGLVYDDGACDVTCPHTRFTGA